MHQKRTSLLLLGKNRQTIKITKLVPSGNNDPHFKKIVFANDFLFMLSSNYPRRKGRTMKWNLLRGELQLKQTTGVNKTKWKDGPTNSLHQKNV